LGCGPRELTGQRDGYCWGARGLIRLMAASQAEQDPAPPLRRVPPPPPSAAAAAGAGGGGGGGPGTRPACWRQLEAARRADVTRRALGAGGGATAAAAAAAAQDAGPVAGLLRLLGERPLCSRVGHPEWVSLRGLECRWGTGYGGSGRRWRRGVSPGQELRRVVCPTRLLGTACTACSSTARHHVQPQADTHHPSGSAPLRRSSRARCRWRYGRCTTPRRATSSATRTRRGSRQASEP
jgi:hypothetical protein